MSADDILFSPITTQNSIVSEIYFKGEKVPDRFLKFEDQRVICRFGVDAEMIIDEYGNMWLYPAKYLDTGECVVEIIYPESRIFKNSNHVIISVNPHPNKCDINHVPKSGTDPVRELWP